MYASSVPFTNNIFASSTLRPVGSVLAGSVLAGWVWRCGCSGGRRGCGCAAGGGAGTLTAGVARGFAGNAAFCAGGTTCCLGELGDVLANPLLNSVITH